MLASQVSTVLSDSLYLCSEWFHGKKRTLSCGKLRTCLTEQSTNSLSELNKLWMYDISNYHQLISPYINTLSARRSGKRLYFWVRKIKYRVFFVHCKVRKQKGHDIPYCRKFTVRGILTAEIFGVSYFFGRVYNSFYLNQSFQRLHEKNHLKQKQTYLSPSKCELGESRTFLPVFHTFKILKQHYYRVFWLLNHCGQWMKW